MKKIILLLVLSCFCYSGFSQSTTAATYALSTLTSTYTSVSGGTVVAAVAADDAVQTSINIGFTFRYCGTNYNTLAANSNGFISLANSGTTGGTSYTNQAASLATIGAGAGMLMPFWDDLNGEVASATSTSCSGVEARYITTGTSPNRVFTFEWFNFGAYRGGATPTATGCGSFQVKLYETTNAIEFCYSSSSFAAMGATIGIANGVADYKILSSNAPFPPFSTSTFTTSIATAPASGIVYRFCPQNIRTTASNGGPYCAGTNAVFTGATTGSGLSFAWAGPSSYTSSIANPTITAATTAATGTYTFTATIGTCSANDTSLLTINPTPVVTGFDSICIGSPATLTSSLSGGTWCTSNAAIASVSATGLVTPRSVGTVNISYTMPTTCAGFRPIRVNAVPTVSAITGTNNTCQGSSTTLADATAGGVWSSGNASIASVNSTGTVFGVSAGSTTISYTVTNSSGCSTSAVRGYTVTIFTIGPITGASSVCVGATTTLGNSTAGGTWSTANASIASVAAASGVVTGVSTGTTNITYTFTNSCGTLDSVTSITVESVPVVGPVSGTTTFCEGTTSTLTDTTTGGVWSTSNAGIASVDASGVVTGVGGGSAVISYTATNSCGPVSSTAAVTINPLPVAGSITGITNVCPGATTTLSDAAAGGTWSSSDNTIATVDGGGVVTGVATGAVTISYTVINGCGTAAATASVTVNSLPDAGTITGPTFVCISTTITISSTVAGGTWSASDNTIASVEGTTGVVTGVAPGSATITYTFTNSCGIDTATSAVTVGNLPSAGTITGTTTVCQGSTTVLADAVSGGTWSTSDNTIASVNTSGIVTGVSAGTATISYSVINTCGTATATAPLTVNPLPSAGTITGVTTVCESASTTLSDTAGGGTWSSGNAAIATVDAGGNVTGVAGGSVTITYSVTTSCGTATATATVTVIAFPNAGAITGTTTFCSGTTSILSNAAAGGTWATSNAAVASVNTTGTVNGIAAGSAVISYTVSNFCGVATVIAPVTITTLPAAGAISGLTGLCIGSSASLSETATGGTWSVNNPSIATINSSGLATGTGAGIAIFSYSVTNSCGTTVDTASTTVLSASSAGVITGPSAVCVGSAVVLANGIAGGTWTTSNAAVATINPSFGLLLGVSAGTAIMSYTIIDACGSTSTTFPFMVDVTANAGIITGAGAVCSGSSVTLSDTTTGGTWSSSNPSAATVNAGGVVTGLSAGTSVISYSVTNSCGTVAATHSIAVNIFPNAGVITGPVSICAGTPVLYSDTAVGGTWVSSNAAIATVDAGGMVTGISAGVVNIYYVVVNACGSTNVTISITVRSTPNTGAITGPGVLCQGATATYADTAGGGTGVWTSGNTAIASVDTAGNVTGISGGTVTISYALTNSCGTGYATRTITIDPLPATGVVGGSATICIGATTTMTETVPGGVWSSSDNAVATIGSTGVVTGVSGGTVSISYTLTNSCGSASATAPVTVRPATNAGTISGSASVCVGLTTTFTDTATGGAWTTSNASIASVSASAVVTGVSAGSATITYTLTDACGTAFTTAPVAVVTAASPGSISGTTTLCQGTTTTLTESVSGGTWSSADSTIASVNAAGVVTGNTGGSVIISYSVVNACGMAVATAFVTVNPLPAPGTITGADSVCLGVAAVYTDTPSGGIWNTSDASIALIDASGNLSPVGTGAVTILYTLTNSCGTTFTTKNIYVNDAPSSAGSLSGFGAVCPGGSVTLSATIAGGAWTSSAGAVATVSPSGVVTGVTAGLVSISYAITNSCGSAYAFDTLRVNAGSGSGVITAAATNACPGVPLTLTDTVAGGTWSSSNSAIATVDTTGIVTGISAGGVTISYTVSNSCGTSTATVGLNIFAAPAITAIGGPATVCEGTATNLTNTYFGGTWTSSDSTVATINASTGLLTAILAGTTNITYSATNVFGCSASATSTEIVSPAPRAGTITTGTTTFCAGTGITLTDTTIGGIWSSSNAAVATVDGSGFVTGLSGGSVDISYTFTNSCGTDVATATLLINPLPVASSILGSTTICTAFPATLSNTTFGGTWTSSDTTIATIGASTGILTGIAAGYVTISYTVSNVYGCSLTTTSADTINLSADAGAITTATTTTCAGYTLALGETVTGGVWSSEDPSIATIDSMGVITAISAGTVNISYTVGSSTGCNSSAVVGFIINPSPAMPSAIIGGTSMCIGSSITLTDTTAGGVWVSSDPSVASVDAATGVVNGVNPGTATISYTITNAYGCSAAATIPDTVSFVPIVTAIGGPSVVCEGALVTLTNGYSGGVWSSSDTMIAVIDPVTGDLGGISAGTVTITYTMTTSGGCFTLITTSDTVLSSPVVTAVTGVTSVCPGNSVTLSVATSGGVWSSSDTTVATVDATGSVTGISGGTATISYTVTNGSGCRTSALAAFTVNPALAISAIAGSDNVCFGSVISLSDSLAGGTWSSSDASVAPVDPTTGYVFGVSVGSAVITYMVTSSFGCISTDTLTIIVNPLPVVPAISGPASVCVGSFITLINDTTGGSWTSAASGIAMVDVTTGVVTGVSTGTTTISYTVTTASGCSTSAVASVTVNATPVLSAISGSASICTGSTTLFTNDSTGGTWTSSDTSIATVSGTGTVTAVAAGTVTVSYSVTNASGCSTVVTFNTTISTLPSAGAITGTTSVCAGGTVTLSDTTVGGTWTSSDTTIANVNSSTGMVTGINAGSATISYTVSGGCSASVTTSFSVHALPAAGTITGVAGICLGTSTTLSNAVSGGIWSSSDTSVAFVNSTTGVVTGLANGSAIITYTVSGSFGCTNATYQNVTVNPAPAGLLLPVSGGLTMCDGNPVNIVLSGSGSTASYQWLINGSVIAGATNSSYVADSAALYSVRVAEGGCSIVISGVTVSMPPNPVITRGAGNIIYTGSFALYQWYLNGGIISGATNSVYLANLPGTYRVVVADGNGCVDTSAVFVISSGGSTNVATVNTTDIKLFPNPSNGIINVAAPFNVNISVLSPDGKLILHAENATKIDISTLSNGMYMIMIYDKDNTLLKLDKFIKVD
ncbi:MAG: Ig-like domain-containing protein [Taibaiella sp.]|nr:Ig-like domain-containing protein [Taibaiella sp.]